MCPCPQGAKSLCPWQWGQAEAYLEHSTLLPDSSPLIVIFICFLFCVWFASFGLKTEASRGMVWCSLSARTEMVTICL